MHVQAQLDNQKQLTVSGVQLSCVDTLRLCRLQVRGWYGDSQLLCSRQALPHIGG